MDSALASPRADSAKYWFEPETQSFRGSSGLSVLLALNERIYSRGQYIGCMHPDDVTKAVGAVDSAVACGSSYEVRYRLIDAKARTHWVCESGRCRTTGDSSSVLLEACITHAPDDDLAAGVHAERDGLTGLLSRGAFLSAVENTLRERSDDALMLIYIDVDRFRSLNGTIGHHGGDAALRIIAKRIGSVFPQALIGRSCADEFLVALPLHTAGHDAASVAASIAEMFADPIVIDETPYHLTASAGMGLFPRDGNALGDLMQSAEAALYDAKLRGGGTCLAGPGARSAMTRAFSLELDLQEAIRRSQLTMRYQPIFDFRTQRVVGAEALVRWIHPTRGVVMPDEFIGAAEHNAVLIRALGNWVADRVCAQIKQWRLAGNSAKVWINISPSQVHQEHFEGDLCARLFEHGVPPSSIGVELTERTFMSRREDAIDALRNLRNAGISIAIDDFGVEYSSLAYVHRLPVDTIKIDRCFVEKVENGRYETAIVRAIMGIALNLGLHVTAEGIETFGQHRTLASLGCNSFQGFLFAEPMEPQHFLELLKCVQNEGDAS